MTDKVKGIETPEAMAERVYARFGSKSGGALDEVPWLATQLRERDEELRKEEHEVSAAAAAATDAARTVASVETKGVGRYVDGYGRSREACPDCRSACDSWSLDEKGCGAFKPAPREVLK